MSLYKDIEARIDDTTRRTQSVHNLVGFVTLCQKLNKEVRSLDKTAIVTKIDLAERRHDAAVMAQDLGNFFIKKWRGRLEFNDHGTVAKQMRKQGIPLNEALLLLFGKPERFVHLAKSA